MVGFVGRWYPRIRNGRFYRYGAKEAYGRREKSDFTIRAAATRKWIVVRREQFFFFPPLISFVSSVAKKRL